MERYDFLRADTRPFRTPEFTTLLGAELHTGYTELGHLWHILAVGLPLDFAPYPGGETGPECAARALAAGAYVAAAHPAWYGLTEGDVRSLGPIHAVESYNATSVDHNDKPESWYMLDLLTMRGLRYTACATDDAHCKPDRHDALRGWVYVKSTHLEPEPLLEALKRGACYSSTGPQIHDIRRLRGNRVAVRCSPAARIFATGHAHTQSCVWGNGLTEAELSLDPFQSTGYFRITVRDEAGGRAWSNPIWL